MKSFWALSDIALAVSRPDNAVLRKAGNLAPERSAPANWLGMRKPLTAERSAPWREVWLSFAPVRLQSPKFTYRQLALLRSKPERLDAGSIAIPSSSGLTDQCSPRHLFHEPAPSLSSTICWGFAIKVRRAMPAPARHRQPLPHQPAHRAEANAFRRHAQPNIPILRWRNISKTRSLSLLSKQMHGTRLVSNEIKDFQGD